MESILMVKIFLNGTPVQFKDWAMSIEKNGEIKVTVTYFSDKKYTRPYEEWRIEPTEERKEDILYDEQKKRYSKIHSLIEVGEKYFLFQYEGSSKIYLWCKERCKLKKSSNILQDEIFCYLKNVAQERLKIEKEENKKIIAQNIVTQFDRIIPSEETALNAYIYRELIETKREIDLIYPFGINETQMNAVKNTFKSQISIIEGPPGTGKTQTILNIIANIVINGGTCAIVSNNNAAVENVYEKLSKEKLDFLVAKLGNYNNRKVFFDNISYEKPEMAETRISREEISIYFQKIEKLLSVKNDFARLQMEIQEIEVEKEYLLEWLQEHPELEVNYIEKYNLNRTKSVDLLAYLKQIEGKKLSLKDKWNLLFEYGIFKSKFLENIKDRESFIFSLQYTYYEKLLKEKEKTKNEAEKLLKVENFEENLEYFKKISMEFFQQYVCEKLPSKKPEFVVDDYQKKFSDFLKYFPVMGSSSHSIVSSIGNGYLLDYIIVDEASQQDLVPGILCLTCARNVIIVGDRKQLSHIATKTSIKAPHKLYDCEKYSLLDSVSEIFGDSVPRTLLKEHYRCHPKIIQFCNKQFYNGELIPMKKDKGEEAMKLIFTSLGNHMRNYANQREIESLMSVEEELFFVRNVDNTTAGFIAPYNNQVRLARRMLPKDITENTIHKFQGKECNKIVFSTVLDKKQISRRNLEFVDNAELVNVAVSRAKDKFILVTGKDVFSKTGYIAALIRYIEYYGNEEAIVFSPVISAFDLLYSEYDKSLEKLAAKLNPADSKYKSEQIVAALFREVLLEPEFSELMVHRQIYLKQLVSLKEGFTSRELKYMENRASCDFVVYYRIGKKPLAVVEVDGGFHNMTEQIERDGVKNSILEKVGISLLRLKTTDGNIMKKLQDFLRKVCRE